MHLVEIDVICIQAAQTPLDTLKNMLARPALLIGTLSHRPKKLCRQHNLFAPAFEPAPNIFLGSPDRLQGSSKWVGVGGIKESNARIKRLIHNGARCWLIALIPKCHCPQAYLGDMQSCTAHALYFHPVFSPHCTSIVRSSELSPVLLREAGDGQVGRIPPNTFQGKRLRSSHRERCGSWVPSGSRPC